MKSCNWITKTIAACSLRAGMFRVAQACRVLTQLDLGNGYLPRYLIPRSRHGQPCHVLNLLIHVGTSCSSGLIIFLRKCFSVSGTTTCYLTNCHKCSFHYIYYSRHMMLNKMFYEKIKKACVLRSYVHFLKKC